MINKKLVILLMFIVISCKIDEKETSQLNKSKETEIPKDFFTILEKKWQFYVLEFDPLVIESIKNWNEWNNFTKELYFKPKFSITAFKQKTKDLSLKSSLLSTSLPNFINKQEIATRFNVLNLQLKNLEMYLNLKKINQKKILKYLDAVNEELLVIEKMINELALKSKIVKEAGEENIIRLKDTTRTANAVIK